MSYVLCIIFLLNYNIFFMLIMVLKKVITFVFRQNENIKLFLFTNEINNARKIFKFGNKNMQ